jgi:hypothetical protein
MEGSGHQYVQELSQLVNAANKENSKERKDNSLPNPDSNLGPEKCEARVINCETIECLSQESG